jgi:hypothetical protein
VCFVSFCSDVLVRGLYGGFFGRGGLYFLFFFSFSAFWVVLRFFVVFCGSFLSVTFFVTFLFELVFFCSFLRVFFCVSTLYLLLRDKYACVKSSEGLAGHGFEACLLRRRF